MNILSATVQQTTQIPKISTQSVLEALNKFKTSNGDELLTEAGKKYLMDKIKANGDEISIEAIKKITPCGDDFFAQLIKGINKNAQNPKIAFGAFQGISFPKTQIKKVVKEYSEKALEIFKKLGKQIL